MNEQKSLLIYLGEALDRYRAARRGTIQEQVPPKRPGRLRVLLPTPGNVLFTLLVVAGLLWANSVGALPLRAPAVASTSTGTIAYQGRLADADGNPLTGTYNMIFRLYDVASGGVHLWEEQWTGSNGVQVSDGLFNVMLGSLMPIPQSVITGNDLLFLGITVGTDDEMTPRVQLGSVPFAVQALTVPDESITSSKRTIATYYDKDNSYVTLEGPTEVTVSEFQFSNVPTGDVALIVTLVGRHPEGASNRGTLYLQADPGGQLNKIPTHVLTTQQGQVTLHGRIQDFTGGILVVRVVASGEIDDTQLSFGASNSDHRFGRRITVIAGL